MISVYSRRRRKRAADSRPYAGRLPPSSGGRDTPAATSLGEGGNSGRPMAVPTGRGRDQAVILRRRSRRRISAAPGRNPAVNGRQALRHPPCGGRRMTPPLAQGRGDCAAPLSHFVTALPDAGRAKRIVGLLFAVSVSLFSLPSSLFPLPSLFLP